MKRLALLALVVAQLLAVGCARQDDWLRETPRLYANPQAVPRLETWSPGPHLFVDDYLITERSGNLVRTTHQPVKLDKAVIAKGPEPWHTMPAFNMRVIHDPSSNLFRIWYNIRNNKFDERRELQEEARTAYGYAQSKDGISWVRPSLGIVEVGGSKDNNLFRKSSKWEFSMFLVDDGPDCPDPQRRYKMVFDERGAHASFSPDGLHWTDVPGTLDTGDTGDSLDGCWDPIRKRYLMVVRLHAVPEDGFKGSTPYVRFEGYRRLAGQSQSRDFLSWTKADAHRIVMPDRREPGVEEIYGMAPRVRGSLYLGFVRILRDDLPADEGGPIKGIGWTELCTSRDGENWTRWRDTFLPRNPRKGTFDHAMAWFGDIVTVGDEDYIYYGGYDTGHKAGDREIGMARLRHNGFVSRDAGDEPATLRTLCGNLGGQVITVNAEVDGELRVRLLDAKGQPHPGFDYTDCRPIHGDKVAHHVQWKGDLSALMGKPVQFEFRMRSAQLYGFDLTGPMK
jgi:hypothetical protein